MYNMSSEDSSKYYSFTKERTDGKYQLIRPHNCKSLRRFRELNNYKDICTNTYGRAGTKFCRMNENYECTPPF